MIENNYKMAIQHALEMLAWAGNAKTVKREEEIGTRMWTAFSASLTRVIHEQYDVNRVLQEMIDDEDDEHRAAVYRTLQEVNDTMDLDDRLYVAFFSIIIGMFPYVLTEADDDNFQEIQEALVFVSCLSFAVVCDLIGDEKASRLADAAFQDFYKHMDKDDNLGILSDGLRGIFNPSKLAERYKDQGEIINDNPDDNDEPDFYKFSLN
jgi:hypothetical protein